MREKKNSDRHFRRFCSLLAIGLAIGLLLGSCAGLEDSTTGQNASPISGPLTNQPTNQSDVQSMGQSTELTSTTCATTSIYCGWGSLECTVSEDGCRKCACVPMLDSTSGPPSYKGATGAP